MGSRQGDDVFTREKPTWGLMADGCPQTCQGDPDQTFHTRAWVGILGGGMVERSRRPGAREAIVRVCSVDGDKIQGSGTRGEWEL